MCLHACVSACLCVSLPACLPACLPVCLPACVSACLCVCLPLCLPACLPACLCVYWAYSLLQHCRPQMEPLIAMNPDECSSSPANMQLTCTQPLITAADAAGGWGPREGLVLGRNRDRTGPEPGMTRHMVPAGTEPETRPEGGTIFCCHLHPTQKTKQKKKHYCCPFLS